MQAFKELYLEIANKVADIEGIKWVDLWHNQINFLEDEHQFPAPAVFLSFRSLAIEDLAEKMQNVSLQIEVYLFYETFADTYKGSVNQQSAFEFIELMKGIYVALHGTNGTNYDNMRRVGFSAVDTGGAGNLYQTIFECNFVDLAAKKTYTEAETDEITITSNPSFVPPVTGFENMFDPS